MRIRAMDWLSDGPLFDLSSNVDDYCCSLSQKRLLDGKEDMVSKRPKLSSSVAYKHASLLPKDAEVQNHRILVG